MALTMLIHSYMHSPQGTITSELWPMDIDHLLCMYNRMPRDDYGISTYELWSRSSFLPSKYIISTLNTWGATTYFLEPNIQKGGYHIPKWAPHSRR